MYVLSLKQRKIEHFTPISVIKKLIQITMMRKLSISILLRDLVNIMKRLKNNVLSRVQHIILKNTAMIMEIFCQEVFHLMPIEVDQRIHPIAKKWLYHGFIPVENMFLMRITD